MSRVLLDTNILLRSINPTHAHSAIAIDATDALRRQGSELCLVPQNIYEFWAVATRPVAVNGLGLSSEDAQQEVDGLLRHFTLLRDERTVFEHWREIVATYQIQGVRSHDARLAAAMQRHKVTAVLTFDEEVFRRIDEIDVLDPMQVAAS